MVNTLALGFGHSSGVAQVTQFRSSQISDLSLARTELSCDSSLPARNCDKVTGLSSAGRPNPLDAGSKPAISIGDREVR